MVAVSAPDKNTFAALLPLSAPSASAFPSLLSPSSAAPSGPKYKLPYIYNVAGPAGGEWPQGPIARQLQRNQATLELLKTTREKFEGQDPFHRIVDRCFALMIHSTNTIEEAGPAPGAPPVAAEEEAAPGKGDKGGKGKKDEKKKK